MRLSKTVVVGVVSSFLLASSALAADVRTGADLSFGAQQTVTDDLYLAGSTVVSYGMVQGDLTVAGGSIVVTGPVAGDLLALGGHISLQGPVAKTVRVAGGNIIVQSAVQNDVVVAGGQVVIAGSGVGRDVVVWGGSVHLDAPVKRNVRISGGNVYLNAPIAGDVTVQAGKLTLGSNAAISGSLTYTATAQADMQPGSRVVGKVTYSPRAETQTVGAGAVAAIATLATLAKFLMTLVLALTLGLFLRRFTTAFVHESFARPWALMGRGVAFLIVLPVLSVLFLVTIIGIPFGILGLITFVAFLVVSGALASILLGSLIYRWYTKRDYEVTWYSILVGTIAYMVLSFIPIIGWLVIIGLTLIAAGTIERMKERALKEWR